MEPNSTLDKSCNLFVPSSLQNIALDKIVQVINNLPENILKQLEVNKPSEESIEEWHNRAENYINQLMEDELLDYLHVNYNLHLKITRKVESILVTKYQSIQMIRSRYVIKCLFHIVWNSRLKSLNFGENVPWALADLLIAKHINKMINLESLILYNIRHFRRIGNQFTWALLEEMKTMKWLKSIELKYYCNDTMIELIANKCPVIESIQAKDCRDVTDNSLPHLKKCKQLKILNFQRPSISLKGIVDLIAHLPLLEDIGTYDKFNEMSEYLTQLDNCEDGPHFSPFNIKRISCSHNGWTNTQLQSIVHFFPKVEHIELNDCTGTKEVNEEIDFSMLALLNNLKSLEICSYRFSFYTNKIDKLLCLNQSRHGTLTKLHLRVLGLNYAALLLIGRNCPNLVELDILDYSPIDSNIPAEHRIAPFSQQPFHKLLTLHWEHEGNHDMNASLQFILVHAKRIKYITLKDVDIYHHNFKKIIQNNGLKHLEELNLQSSMNNDLSTKTINLLLENCPNLRRLFDIFFWHGMSEQEKSEMVVNLAKFGVSAECDDDGLRREYMRDYRRRMRFRR